MSNIIEISENWIKLDWTRLKYYEISSLVDLQKAWPLIPRFTVYSNGFSWSVCLCCYKVMLKAGWSDGEFSAHILIFVLIWCQNRFWGKFLFVVVGEEGELEFAISYDPGWDSAQLCHKETEWRVVNRVKSKLFSKYNWLVEMLFHFHLSSFTHSSENLSVG